MAYNNYALPAVVLPTPDHLNLYVPGRDLSHPDRKSLCAFILSGLIDTTADSKDLLEVSLAAFLMVIPELAQHLAEMTVFTIDVVPVSTADVEAFVSGNVRQSGSLSNFPMMQGYNAEALSVDSDDGVYAAISCLLTAICKQGGTGPEAAAVKARPQALIGRFEILEDQQLLLPGKSLGPSAAGLDRIYMSFSTFTEARSIIVKYFLAISNSQRHLPRNYEILMTNFRLLRNTGMTHVDAINKLLNMHPWTVRVPQLRPYYEKYAAELTAFQVVPVEVREFHRLLVPQGSFKFLTSEYRPLIAVAGSYVEEVESTFKGYVYNKEEYASLIRAVRAYQPGTAAYIGPSLLAEKLGIQDMTLPSTLTAAAPTGQPMV